MEPVFSLRIVAEKYRRNNTALPFLFLDMQKVSDCVPRMMTWWALHSKRVPEIYVNIIRDMYCDSDYLVLIAVGDTKQRTDSQSFSGQCYIIDVLSDSIRDGDDYDVKPRITLAWAEWREMSGILCETK